MRTLFLQNYVVPVRIGIHAEEKIRKQRLSITVSIKIRGVDVLDYSFMKTMIDSTVLDEYFEYQENLADRLLGLFLSTKDADRFEVITLTTKKLDIYADCGGVGVETVWNRRRPHDNHDDD